MIAIVDKEEPGVSTLQDAIDDLEPSVANSLPELSTIHLLASQAEHGSVDPEIREDILGMIPELLEHDRSSVHRIAALTGVLLVDTEPDTADRLLDQLIPLLEKAVTERRTIETIEYLATPVPDAVGQRHSVMMDRIGHPRDGVSRHAAGALLAVAMESPERLVGIVPRMVLYLTEKFDPVTSSPRETHGGNLQSLERHRRLEHESSRLLVARTIAAVTETCPDGVAEAIIDSGTVEQLSTLFDDQQSTVRAAAVGVASHIAEQEPELFKPSISQLFELLSDENEIVRGGAIWTLGALDHPETTERLRVTRDNDPSEELQELAASVLDPDAEPKLT
ncbi:HEAT repeat domain-containing protein [Saliphagus sp. LR7]|uniref:HEAT repeat domain-containing protein n=1 Tax=Saliphagus sp. LR7 TaxID=2282654 RepID=UPI000DF7A355|nr:HEAT repeat domain-containing protein [Saliphagus sp. LR7]